VPIDVSTPSELESAFGTLKQAHAEGLLILLDPLFFTQAMQIVALASAARLPTIHVFRQDVVRGGLISYGVDFAESFRRSASLIDRILKGSRAGDLPIELPTKFELIINLRTATTLGLEVPNKLLFTADEVIE
jgi:putative ABC transport system substrate-binding protein